MKAQPAMIAINIVITILAGIWMVQLFLRGDTGMGALLGIICVVNGFIAVRRYQLAKRYDSQ